MIVVADTTPIISLLKLNRLDLLEELFGTVFIPQFVLQELTMNINYQSEAEAVLSADFIMAKNITDRRAVNVLMKVNMLDRGESEAIILADELSAEVLLIDERKGRRIAKQLGINLSGTLGVLMKAFDKKLLDTSEVLHYLDELQKNNRQLGQKLIDHVKQHIGQ